MNIIAKNINIENVDSNKVKQWLNNDIDPETRNELLHLIKRAKNSDPEATAELVDAFSTDLTFGTAGLRGKMGPGPNRMNATVVARAAKGICNYLTEKLGPNFNVTIGYDARHNSAEWAMLTAEIVSASGGKPYIMPRPLPTPIAVYTANVINTDATIVVTASHNPAQDNGYKVYLGERLAGRYGKGVQIIPPADKEIYQHIMDIKSVPQIQRSTKNITIVEEKIILGYTKRVASKASELVNTGYTIERNEVMKKQNLPGIYESPYAKLDLEEVFNDPSTQAPKRKLRIVTTAMHGVGGKTLNDLLKTVGFNNVHTVACQSEPDPDFPTVSFPNPEEAGALDKALELAQKVNADLVLAVDPDADRCSIAIKDRYNNFYQVNGDQIGALLGNLIGYNYRGKDVAMANSIVSSRLLAKIAKYHNISHARTLTGFKWIGRTPKLVFGYEEAIGFCLDPESIRDKDGIMACLTLALYAELLKLTHCSLNDKLQEIYFEHGLHLTTQVSFRVDDMSLIQKALDKFIHTPPTSFDGKQVDKFVNLESPATKLPPTAGVAFYTTNGMSIIIRPSGTEPKMKCYIEKITDFPSSVKSRVNSKYDLPEYDVWIKEQTAILAEEVKRIKSTIETEYLK